MTYDKPITIQSIDETTEQWTDLLSLHARVNRSNGDEYYNEGAIRSKQTLVFDVRYNSLIEPIALNTQRYRIVYRNHNYNIEDYDDYMEEHRTVKLTGVSY